MPVEAKDLRRIAEYQRTKIRELTADDVAALPIESDGYIHVTETSTWLIIGDIPAIFLAPIYVEPQVTHWKLEGNITLTLNEGEAVPEIIYFDAYGTGKAFITTDYLNAIIFNYCFVSAQENLIFDCKNYTIIYYAFKSEDFSAGQVVTGGNSTAYGTIVKEIQTSATEGMLMLRNESTTKFITSPPEPITDPLGGYAFCGQVLYRSTDGFVILLDSAFLDTKGMGRLNDGSSFNFAVLFQQLRGGWIFDNTFSVAFDTVYLRQPILELPYDGQSPDQDFSKSSTISNQTIPGVTATVLRDVPGSSSTTGTLYIGDVLGPFFNDNSFTDGTITATVDGTMSSIIFSDVQTYTAVYELNSSFILLGYQVAACNFDSEAVILAASLNGSPGILAGGQYFATGSLDQSHPSIRVSNCPPASDSQIKSYASFSGNSTSTTITATDKWTKLGVNTWTEPNKERISTTSAGLSYYTGLESASMFITHVVCATIDSPPNNTPFGGVIYKGNSGLYVVSGIADAGGGQLTVSLSIVPYVQNGDEVFITGTTSYNDSYTVSNVVSTPPYSFDVTGTYVADETGFYEIVLAETATTFYLRNDFIVPAPISSIVNVITNDYFDIAVRNELNTDNVTAHSITRTSVGR